MAIHNPSTLYSGGSAVVNSTPFTMYYLNTQARERAKRDALDQYYAHVGKTLTPTGMVSDDVPDFLERKNRWQQHAIETKDILNNPRDPRYAEELTKNNALFNDAQSVVGMSQSRGKDINEFYNFIKPGHPLTAAAMAEMNKLSVPVAKGYQRPDAAKVMYEPKPYTYADHNKLLNDQTKGITLGQYIPKEDIQIVNGKRTKVYTTHYAYDPKSLDVILDRAENIYDNDPNTKDFVDRTMMDETDYNRYNPTFKAITGRDIEKPSDRLAAEMFLKLKQPYNVQKVQGDNPYQGYNVWGPNNPANQVPPSIQFSNDLIDAFSSGDKENIKNVIGRLFAGNTSYKLEPEAYGLLDNGQLAINIRPTEKDKYGDKKDAQLFLFDINDPDLKNKLVGLYQQTIGSDVKGETKTFVEPKEYTPPKQDQPKSKQAKAKSYDVSGKAYSHAELRKLGYTEDQIQQAIKLGTVKPQ